MNNLFKLTKKQKKTISVIITVVFLCFSLVIYLGEEGLLPFSVPRWDDIYVALGITDNVTAQALSEQEIAAICYISVGQGDSTFIITKEKTVLIDAGERDSAVTICTYIKQMGIEKIDLLIATHPHADHIGGMVKVMETFTVGTVLLPEMADTIVPTTSQFMQFIQAVEKKNLNAEIPTPGDKYPLAENVVLTILSPGKEYDDLNNVSIVCRLDAGKRSFLFMGDAETPVEKDLLAAGARLKADVLKLGHHGSSTSSGSDFLAAVSPKMVVASCGVNNSYGHPHREIIQRAKDISAKLYRTDRNGSIVIRTDGEVVTIDTEEDAA